MKRPKILFVTTHFSPDYHFGGVVESGGKMLKYLKKISDIDLICVSQSPNKVEGYLSSDDIICKSNLLHNWGFSFSLIFTLFFKIKSSNKIYVNGIVTFPTTLAQIYSIILKKPFIVSIRGGLEPWSVNSKSWKKKPFFKYITYPLLKKAALIHLTSIPEEKTLNNLGFFNSFVVPNGIDTEVFQDLPPKQKYLDKYGNQIFLFLFLSRTDKEKGIDILLDAYQNFCNKYEKNRHLLLLVGPDNQGYLKSLKINYFLNNIEYINGLYGLEKIELLRKASVLLLPSYSENFGNIIAEALACELPVITTTGTPWEIIEAKKCGFYISPNSNELFLAMEKMYNLENSLLNEMGNSGRCLIMNDFSWDKQVKLILEKLYSI